jgi:hypothetical protein
MSTENNKRKQSPRITHISWGRMDVEGLGTGRDFKLYPGGGREWDWTETGTHHVPGIQATDVQELLDHGSKVLILTRGMQLVLRTCPETLQMLHDRGITYHARRRTRQWSFITDWRRPRLSAVCFTRLAD